MYHLLGTFNETNVPRNFESKFLTVHVCGKRKPEVVLFDLDATELEQAGRKLLTY